MKRDKVCTLPKHWLSFWALSMAFLSALGMTVMTHLHHPSRHVRDAVINTSHQCPGPQHDRATFAVWGPSFMADHWWTIEPYIKKKHRPIVHTTCGSPWPFSQNHLPASTVQPEAKWAQLRTWPSCRLTSARACPLDPDAGHWASVAQTCCPRKDWMGARNI